MKKFEKKQFLPFHAVNEFMRDDYRLNVLQNVFTQLDECKGESRTKLLKLFGKEAQIPGFRNSSQAPAGLKAKNGQRLFEKSAVFAALVMDCWSQLHAGLFTQVHAYLLENGWKMPTLQEARVFLPGFQLDWPKEQTFENIIQAVRKNNPELTETDDDISLMVVWVGNKLPYNLYESGDEPDQSENSSS
jgi:hypothetical protein